MKLDRVVFIPAGSPPHKGDRRVTPPEDRYAMTLLATAGVPEFFVSRMEIDRPYPTHTVDTLESFLNEGISASDLFFITGLDAVLSMTTWFEWERIPQMCTLVTASRPGYSVGGIDGLPSAIRDNLVIVETPQFAMSSTEIRERSCRGQSIRFLVPHLVETYIESNELYKAAKNTLKQ